MSGADAGGSGGACELATGAGQKVVVDCATQVTLRDDGNGLRARPPSGSICNGEQSYSLDIASRALSWSMCTFHGSEPWTLDQGMRALSDAELQSALSGLRSVTIQSKMSGCGADKPTLTIEVSIAGGRQTYTDSFYACSATPGAIYVDNIDVGFQAVTKLAHL